MSDVEARFVSMFDPLAVRNLRALAVCHHCGSGIASDEWEGRPFRGTVETFMPINL
jgi:hypothetical protein